MGLGPVRMSVILLILGIVAAASGVITIGFCVPINEFTLGTTLIIAGTTALTGGLVLIGLSAVVSEIGRLAESIKGRAPARPMRTGEIAEPMVPAVQMGPPLPAAAPPAAVRPPPPQVPVPARARPEKVSVREPRPAQAQAAAPSSVDVSAAAIERLRSSIPRSEAPRGEQPLVAETEEVTLSPNGAAQSQPVRETTQSQAVRETTQAQPVREVPEQHAVEQSAAPEEQASETTAVEALKSSRLDFLFRSKPARPAPQPENFDAIWPAEARTRRAAVGEPQVPPRPEQIERRSDTAPVMVERRAEAPPPQESRTPAILKSGVVDGMAYTLYADGSIEAKLPQGTMKFGSIAELRAHIEKNS